MTTNYFNIFFEFEFYSNKDLNWLIKEFKKEVGQPISFYNSKENYKIIPKVNDLNGKFCIVTPLFDHNQCIEKLKTILEFLDSISNTDETTNLNVGFKFTDFSRNVYYISPVKIILNFNDKMIYENFPHLLASYKLYNFKKLFLKDYITQLSNYDIDFNDFLYPNTNYQGILFNQIEDNIIKFTYINGENYTKKYKEIKSVIENWIQQIQKMLENPKITKDEKYLLEEKAKRHLNIKEQIRDYNKLKGYFPNIEFSIDMDDRYQYINSYWYLLKDKIYDYLINGINKAQINYDSNRSRIQIKDCHIIDSIEFENVDFVNTTFNQTCILNNCNLYDSYIASSRIYNTYIYDCDVYNSFLENSFSDNNLIKYCFIQYSQFDDDDIKNSYLIKSKVSQKTNLTNIHLQDLKKFNR